MCARACVCARRSTVVGCLVDADCLRSCYEIGMIQHARGVKQLAHTADMTYACIYAQPFNTSTMQCDSAAVAVCNVPAQGKCRGHILMKAHVHAQSTADSASTYTSSPAFCTGLIGARVPSNLPYLQHFQPVLPNACTIWPKECPVGPC